MLKLFSLGQNMRIRFAVMQLENRGEVVGLRRLRAIWIIANIHFLFAKQNAQDDGQLVVFGFEPPHYSHDDHAPVNLRIHMPAIGAASCLG